MNTKGLSILMIALTACAGGTLWSGGKTEPIDIKAFANSASNLSKTGSPIPEGQPLTIISTMPPTESPCLATFKIKFSRKENY